VECDSGLLLIFDDKARLSLCENLGHGAVRPSNHRGAVGHDLDHDQDEGPGQSIGKRSAAAFPSYGSLARSLGLPFEVKDEQVDAKFKDGVLTDRLPKPAEVQNHGARSR
jgi:hypothetical protein